MEQVTLRHAVESDLPRIVEIYNASVPARIATADTQPITVDSRRAWFAEHSPDKRPLIVAVAGDQLIGFISFRNYYGRPAYHATAEIGSYLDPAWQSKGVGSRLLEEAIRVAPACGLKTLLAFIFAHNAPSLGIVKKYGFTEWGRLPAVAELDGVWRDLVIMGRKL